MTNITLFQRILCPIDFSQASCEALKVAVSLADGNATEVCVLHVGQPVRKFSGELSPGDRYAGFSDAGTLADAVVSLCGVLEECVPSWVCARPLLKCGDAASEILRIAHEENADLIVLATRGVERSMGHVIEEVVLEAPCPVLTLGSQARMKCLALTEADPHSEVGQNPRGSLLPLPSYCSCQEMCRQTALS